MVRRSKLSEAAICLLYRNGEPRDGIVLRAGISDFHVVEILRRNGEPLRNDAEWRQIAIQNRQRWKSTERLRQRQKLMRRKGGE